MSVCAPATTTATLLLVGLALAGCGGSGDAESALTPDAATPTITSAPTPSLTPVAEVREGILQGDSSPSAAQAGRLVQAWWERFTPEQQNEVCSVYKSKKNLDFDAVVDGYVEREWYGSGDMMNAVAINTALMELLDGTCL